MVLSNPFDPKTHPNCFAGHGYALEVHLGDIPSCIYVKGAANRYLTEVAKDHSPNYYFNPDKAEKFLRSVQKFDHVIGTWKTTNIVYEPWQCFIFMNIMGFINRTTGFRRFRTAHIEIGRGNGKSLLASSTALYFLSLDGSQGNQIATVATKKEQARIVLDSSRAMAKKNKSFLKATGVKVLAHTITQEKTNSIMRALSAEASSLDGLNDVLAVCDELHAMRRSTFEVISSGMSKRTDSLLLCITTAGMDIESVGYSQSVYAKNVSLGDIQDETFFSIVYTLDPGDDIYEEVNWVKANPNWGVSVDPDTFRAKAEKTKSTPADLPGFKVKHLNLWLSEANAFYDPRVWDECADPTLDINDFKKDKAKLGLDLASHIDLTCWVSVFKRDEIYYVFEKVYIPEDTIREAANDLYAQAIAQGFLIETKGAAINNEFIRKEILDFSREFKVSECFYDAWNATEMAQNISSKVEMVKFPMTVANFSEPMKKLDTLMREGKIRHRGSPLTRWCLSNVVAKEDHNGNVFPRKSHVAKKIDIIVALQMALGGWLQNEEVASAYEYRGLRTLGGSPTK